MLRATQVAASPLWFMDTSVREHIRLLQEHIQHLGSRIMENRLSLRERNQIESEIRAAESLIEYYRNALEIEKKLLYNKE